MIKETFQHIKRKTKQIHLNTDLVVVGGGLAGVCSSITAARAGLKVVLVQDRPVLGGNASSEVRLWSLGATSHMGNNNRWSRESGVINEILLDNLKRNKEGNHLILDTILLEKVYEEENITLLLNTSVYEVSKKEKDVLERVTGFCSQNSTTYHISSRLFCDASGDGIVAFQAGASFRMGAEKKEEFDEGFAPNVEDYGELLGHSLYFYTKDVKKPISFKPPSFAIKNADELPRIKNYKVGDQGCNFWWVEYGGRLDTIHQSEDIKFELWKVVYGIWDYIKNSGKYPETANLTLEWVGTIPGKRESRRFEGDYMISQKDIVQQRDFYDAIAHGGWAMDLHPADGVYSKHNSCSQWHSKGIYGIPYRCLYSKDIRNLFLAGRIISATHVAFGSTRVMLTCAFTAQAVGEAAALCIKNDWNPRKLSDKKHISSLQLALNRNGQSIPNTSILDHEDLATKASLEASSEMLFDGFKAADEWQTLTYSTAQLLPLEAQTPYLFSLKVEAIEDTTLTIQLRIPSKNTHFTPDVTLQTEEYRLSKGKHTIEFKTNSLLKEKQYAYLCLMANKHLKVRLSNERCSAIMTVQNKKNIAVSNYGKQEPPKDFGIDAFEFWTPERRPKGKNLAFSISPKLTVFRKDNLTNTAIRPEASGETNVWMAAKEDENAVITLTWEKEVELNTIRLFFDCDYDHALECSLIEHPESEIPFVVSQYTIENKNGKVLASVENNHQAIHTIQLENTIKTDQLIFKFSKKRENIPISVFKISVFQH